MAAQVALLIFTFLGTVLILIPTAFHIQNRNVAVVCLCLWLSILNAITFINGLVWNRPMSDDSAVAEGYCDISTRIQLVADPALLGCAIAILRFLASILSSKGLSTNMRSTRFRQNSIDLALIFVVPFIILVAQLAVYRNPRYTVYSFYGCSLTLFTSNSPYMLLMYIWSPLLAMAAVFYAVSIILALNRKRKDFKQVLQNSNAGLDLSRFLRLFILAILAIFIIAPIVFYQFWGQVRYLTKEAAMPQGYLTDIVFIYDELSARQLWAQWFCAIMSCIFAGLFGIGREARNNYSKWFSKVPGSERLLALSSRVSMGVSRNWSGRFSRTSHLPGASCTQNSHLDDASTLMSGTSECEMANIKVTTKTTFTY